MADQLKCYKCQKVIIEDAERYANKKLAGSRTMRSKNGKVTSPQPVFAWKETCPYCHFDNGGMTCLGNHLYLLWVPFKALKDRYKLCFKLVYKATEKTSIQEFLKSVDDIFEKNRLLLEEEIRFGNFATDCLHIYG